MIELKGLSKTYTVSGSAITALRPLDLTIRKGEFVSIVGHSGSGKSTLLSLIGGIALPDTGTVLIDGHQYPGLRRCATVTTEERKVRFCVPVREPHPDTDRH